MGHFPERDTEKVEVARVAAAAATAAAAERGKSEVEYYIQPEEKTAT